jgi:hypothetical protein
VVGDPPGLPEDVGHDDDREVVFEVHELPLDVLARLGVEGRDRLVAQDDLGRVRVSLIYTLRRRIELMRKRIPAKSGGSPIMSITLPGREILR